MGKSYGRKIASSSLAEIGKSQRRIVVLKTNSGDPVIISKSFAKRYRGIRGHVYKHALKGFAISLSDQAVAKLKKDSRVRYIVNDRPVKAFAQTTPVGIGRLGATRNATAAIASDGGDVDIDIAVLDTGADLDHPDLNVFNSVNFSKGRNANDGHGHGTHVAGTIAARDNDSYVVGVAPGARLWIIRVLDNKGNGWTSDIIKGIDYVTANADKIEVANMSLGGVGSDDGSCGLTNNDPQHEAICNVVAAGVVMVVAAGNESDDAANHVPAAYDEVITVSAFADSDGIGGGSGPATSYGADDTFASFSNFGEDVDISAPGVDILSTYKGGSTASMSGTSMAAPHIAGLAGLYIAINGRATDGAGVLAIKDGLITTGIAQSGPDGFSDDPDQFEEPLGNAEAIDPTGPVTPAVKLTVTSDQPSYNLLNGEDSALVTTNVVDELGNPIEGLLNSAFEYLLDGGVITTNTAEGSPGLYQAAIGLVGLADGTHSVSVQVSDDRALTGNNATNFTTTTATTPTIHVGSISYGLQGGKNKDRNLLILVTVADSQSESVDGASVSVDLYRDGKYVGSATATTDSIGEASFLLRNAKTGCYSTTINSISKEGTNYDASQNQADPGICK
ncbi:MAG: S8 family serine peptidase [Bdellovibrionales bacterium]|nr:S8 family serine peptidase [Bdellovibrionales bacterium]MBT3524778.1 S8 family serine peptidase [Bdellovibrionales bacterium]MBT7767139.1 S8 family serine peptidase [Bdellovibrionales bacterium]